MSTSMSQSLLPEFDHEMANTRKVLERVPEDRPDYRPHPKSMTIARLAGHLTDIPWWAVTTLTRDEYDMQPVGGSTRERYMMTTREALLTRFDAEVAAARAALAATSDAALMQPWTLKHGGHTIFSMPRASALRSFVLNHNVHHRAQLGVYLRLNDVAVPSIYGPSADEGGL
ncbi:MAG: DinB family protein [Acidobacteriota bacterium]